MGIALFTLSALFAPLQQLVSRLIPSSPVPTTLRQPSWSDGAAHRVAPRIPHTLPPQPCLSRTILRKDCTAMSRRTLHLRVVRTVEAGIPAGSTGRMVISGRMADVCAELERLAALEAKREGGSPGADSWM